MHEVDDNQLLEATEFVWNSTLGLILEPTSGSAGDPEERMGAVVEISGAWKGSIVLTTTRAMALHAAAQMFGCDETDVSDDDRHDAVGELANQIGGSVKGMLPGPCSLSLPRVWDGDGDADAPTADGRPAGVLDASSGGQAVHVDVVAHGDHVV